MNLRTLIILGLAVVSGLGTVLGVKQMQSADVDVPQPDKVETVEVVVAAVDLPRLTLLKPEDLTLQPWPKDLIPAGAVRSKEDAVGKTLRHSKQSEQPIFRSDVDSGRGIDVLIPKDQNLRLMSILTPSEASNVAGLIQPGDHVDVNLIMSATGRNGELITTGGAHARLLLQNVIVISVGQQVEITDEKKIPGPYQSVTVAVTPQQSLLLQLAGTKGTLKLTLRKAGDETMVETNPITLAELRALGGFGNAGSGAHLADEEDATETSNESEQKLVTVYQRIRTQRGTAAGQVFFRTQQRRSRVPHEPEESRLSAGLKSSVGAHTP